MLPVYCGFLPFCCQNIYSNLTMFEKGLSFTWCWHCFHSNFEFIFLCVCVYLGLEQTSVLAGWYTDTWWLLGEIAAQQPTLRPAFEPTLAPSLTGENGQLYTWIIFLNHLKPREHMYSAERKNRLWITFPFLRAFLRDLYSDTWPQRKTSDFHRRVSEEHVLFWDSKKKKKWV